MMGKYSELRKFGEELAKEMPEGQHRGMLLRALHRVTSDVTKALPDITVKIAQQAAKNGGRIKLGRKFTDMSTMWFNKSANPSNMSSLEVWVHEMYHAATIYAVYSADPEIVGAMRSIYSIRKNFLDKTTAQDLVPYMSNQATALEDAKKILKYFADPKVGIQEFIAYSQTNYAVMKQLESLNTEKKDEEYKNLFSKVVAKIRELFRLITLKVTKEPTGDDLTRMSWLVDKLMEVNNRALERKRTTRVDRLLQFVDRLNTPLAKLIESNVNKVVGSAIPKAPVGKYASYWWLGKLAMRALIDEKAKHHLVTTLSFIGLKQEGTLQTWFREMTKGDKYSDGAEQLGLLSNNVDRDRDLHHRTATYTMYKALNLDDTELQLAMGKSKEELADSIGVMVETDASILSDREDYQELHNPNEYALDAAIKEAEEWLGSRYQTEVVNYFKFQAKGLAGTMKSGVGSVVYLNNAESIAHRVNWDGHQVTTVDEDLVTVIDQLTSLYALKNSDKTRRNTLYKLMDYRKEGVRLVAAYMDATNKESKALLFAEKGDKFRYTKGYLKEIYPENMDVQVAPLAVEAELKKQGFVLHKKLAKHSDDGSSMQMGFYISKMPVRPGLHKVAFRYTDTQVRGTTFAEHYDKETVSSQELKLKVARDVRKVNERVQKYLDQVAKKGYVDITQEDRQMMPLINGKGQVSDFRYVMSNEDKVEVLKLSTDWIDRIGATRGSIIDKVKTKEHNEKVLKFLAEDAVNYVDYKVTKAAKEAMLGTPGLNNKEYVWVGPESREDVRALFKLLPKSVKEAVPNGFPVRRDMLHTIIGFREISAANAKFVKGMPIELRYAIQVAEKVWKEVIKVAKSSIILKTPIVLIGNVVSNLMYSIITGSDPIQVAKLQMQAVRELNEYIAKYKRLVHLEAMEVAGKASEKELTEIGMIRNEIELSPLSKLMDKGFYTQITEEMDQAGYGSNSLITQWADAKLKNAPKLVRNGLDWLFLTEKTPVYKFMNTATQYSDFVARYAEFHLLKRKGVDTEKALTTVMNAFVNYTKPSSPFVEYLNQMGLVMFTKYFTRIQRAIGEVAKGHPLNALLVLLAQEYLIGDIADVTDSSIIVKDLANLVYDPVGNLVQAVTPSSFRLAADVLR